MTLCLQVNRSRSQFFTEILTDNWWITKVYFCGGQCLENYTLTKYIVRKCLVNIKWGNYWLSFCYWSQLLYKVSCTVVEKSPLYFVLLYYSHKSWFIFKTRDRFEICWSWHFQNTLYMYNLTKFWLRYFKLKTHTVEVIRKWTPCFPLFRCDSISRIGQWLYVGRSLVELKYCWLFR